MIDEHKKIIGIPEGHKLVRNDFEWLGPDSEKDTEVHYYEELNALGKPVSGLAPTKPDTNSLLN